MELTARTPRRRRLDGGLPLGAAALRQLASRSPLRALRRRELHDYVELDPRAFYARLRTAADTPTTSQPTPGDFLAVYEELAGYERILSLHIAGKLSGTIETRAPRQSARRRSRSHARLRAPPRRSRCCAGDPAPSRARHERRRGEKLVERYGDARSCSSPSTRSSTSPAAAASAGPGPGRASC